MMPPKVVHRELVQTETAVLCADGRVHYGPEYLRNDDPQRVLAVADTQDARCDVTWCGGAPHYLATRRRITTAWERAS